jgi:hypothetical protein
METTSGELTDFCLVLVPDGEAVATAGEAVRKRFTFLAEETRIELATSVAQRVEKLLERGAGAPIMVMIELEDGVIQGEVSDRGELDVNGARPDAGFEIRLPGLD